jgi:hypothetical protein
LESLPPVAPEPAPAPLPEKPLAGKVTPLNDPVLSPGGALAETPRAAAIRPDVAARPGRADDFSWPNSSWPSGK